jgi:plastocyanin
MLLGGGLALLIQPASAGLAVPVPSRGTPGVTESVLLDGAAFPAVPITITTGGLRPRVVTVTTCTPVQWINRTTVTQSIVAGARPSTILYLPLITRGSSGAMARPAGHELLNNPQSTDWGGLVHANGGTFTRTFPSVGLYPYYLAADPNLAGMVMVMNLTNFTIDAVPSKMVSRGGHAKYTVRIVDRGLLPSSVGLTVTDAQGGTSFSWSANPATPTQEVVLTVAAASEAPLGAHHLTIAGHDGCLQRSATATLYVVNPPVSSLYLPVTSNDAWPGTSSQSRFGFAVHSDYGLVTDYNVGLLRAGWYVDYRLSRKTSPPAGLEFVPIVHGSWLNASCAQLTPHVSNSPGSWWLIGNEPDNIYHDNLTPDEYARRYHDLHLCIKAHDPSARVSPGGITQPTPLRLRWLDMVIESYQDLYDTRLPADGWHIHTHFLEEHSCRVYPDDCWGAEIPPGIDATEGVIYSVQDSDNFAYFKDHIRNMRKWMKRNGYQNSALFVSEYGVIMPAEIGMTEQRVVNFMYNTFDYMLTTKDCSLGYTSDGCRLVQRWAWFSLNEKMYDPECEGQSCGGNGNLFDPSTRTITAFGLAYRNRPYY